VLIEHCAGKFPLWLAPEQVTIIPISEKFENYAKNVSELLKNYDIRSQIDNRSEKTGKKIRDAEIDRIPYMLIVGEKEEAEGTVSVRKQAQGDLGSFSIEGFAALINDEIKKAIE
jgi:threonyl-tRNA synthetase